MHPIVEFLRKAGTFYLATADGNQPRVRPFGAVSEFEGRIYIQTGNQKAVFAQLEANPRVEISGMIGERWIRLSGVILLDPRREARAAMLEQNPALRDMYSEDDGICEVLYFREGIAKICSFTAPPETYRICPCCNPAHLSLALS